MPKPQTLKNLYRETQIFKSRAIIAGTCVVLLMLVLLSRMFYLQVIQHEKYTTLSEKNRVSTEPTAPTRGLITDRHGTLLAENQPSHVASIVIEEIEDLDQTLAALKQLVHLSSDDIDTFQTRLKRRRQPFASVPLRYRLTEQEIARIAVNQHRLTGVKIEAKLMRYYPHKGALAHSIGYVGRINEKEVKTIDTSNYSATHHIGKVGVEKAYETVLHGTAGHRIVEKNARGRVMRTLEAIPPVPGANLTLHLDLPTQLTAIEALGHYRGSVVAIEPATGGIIALVSTPAYDPNPFVTGIDYKSYEMLQTSPHRPLFNRAVTGQYPPGSTIKPIVGLAGLEHHVISWENTLSDPGWYMLAGDERRYRDWKKTGHGIVDLEKSIIQSCDTYFYDAAHKLGIDKLHDFMAAFNFGKRTGIDIPGERPGILPSQAWKQKNRRQPWYPGETLITGIGQGFMLATPLQLALATAILANNGKTIKPRMVKSLRHPVTDHTAAVNTTDKPAIDNTTTNNTATNNTKNETGAPSRAGLPKADTRNTVSQESTTPSPARIVLDNHENWARMNQTMQRVIHSPRGTAAKISKGLTYKIAGKTGTAQVLGIKQDAEYDETLISEWHRDHALFIGFAPADNPEIAVAVLVENGGSGGSTAAPIARQVIDAFFEANPETANFALTNNE